MSARQIVPHVTWSRVRSASTRRRVHLLQSLTMDDGCGGMKTPACTAHPRVGGRTGHPVPGDGCGVAGWAADVPHAGRAAGHGLCRGAGQTAERGKTHPVPRTHQPPHWSEKRKGLSWEGLGFSFCVVWAGIPWECWGALGRPVLLQSRHVLRNSHVRSSCVSGLSCCGSDVSPWVMRGRII